MLARQVREINDRQAGEPEGGQVQLVCEVCGDRFYQRRGHHTARPARCCSNSCAAERRCRLTVEQAPPAKVSDAEFLELLMSHQRLIRWMAGRRYERLDADDVLQETNLLLWRLRAYYDPDRVGRNGRRTSFASFAARQMWNAAATVHARTFGPIRAQRAGLRVLVSREESPVEVCERREVVADVRKAVDALPRRQRERVAERLAGASITDMVAQYGVARQSVELAIQNAKAKLRGGLGRHAGI